MGTPKVTIRGGKEEYAGRIREIVAEHKKIRIKLHCCFYDPKIQKYVLMKGDHIGFDCTSVSFALGIKERLVKLLFGDEK